MSIHPTGNYDAEVVEYGIAETKSGKDQLSIKFRTEHGEIYGRLYFTDGTIKKTIESLQTLGFKGQSFSELNEGSALVGNKCNISINHEPYDGKQQAKVGWINPIGYEGPGGGIKRAASVSRTTSDYDVKLRAMNPKPVDDALEIANADDIPF